MDPRDAPILVVDGDDAGRTVLRRACEAEGIGVVEAATGAAGIDLASAGCFCAILVGSGLPDLAGLEVCRRVRSGDPVTPILMIGAPGGPAPAERSSHAAGADGLVATPYDLPRLIARLHAYR
jgi:DNA-binding response OmpR family regulator